MEPLLFTHLIAVGVWAGCVATEVVLELALKHVPPIKSQLAVLHAKIDRFVELPAILIAAATGAALLGRANFDLILGIKVVLGVSAVVMNLVAAFTVDRRLRCLQVGDMAGYARFDVWHERVGGICILSIVGAIAIGGIRLAG